LLVGAGRVTVLGKAPRGNRRGGEQTASSPLRASIVGALNFNVRHSMCEWKEMTVLHTAEATLFEMLATRERWCTSRIPDTQEVEIGRIMV
jgi:hypothetical protein